MIVPSQSGRYCTCVDSLISLGMLAAHGGAARYSRPVVRRRLRPTWYARNLIGSSGGRGWPSTRADTLPSHLGGRGGWLPRTRAKIPSAPRLPATTPHQDGWGQKSKNAWRRMIDDCDGGSRGWQLLLLWSKTRLWRSILAIASTPSPTQPAGVASHDANIVVSGDADLTIGIQATANRGWVASSGTIDDAVVRDAIVRTVNGGVEGFRLRHERLGF